jgi:small-conductance mechanosensitive channel
VLPLQQWTIRREYLRRLKVAFDRADIQLQLPRMALYGPAPAHWAAGAKVAACASNSG